MQTDAFSPISFLLQVMVFEAKREEIIKTPYSQTSFLLSSKV